MAQITDKGSSTRITSSSDIDKVYRDGVNLPTAIASHLRRSTAKPLPPLPDPTTQASVPGSVPADASPPPVRIKQRAKRVLRSIIIPFYRAAKPLARPVSSKVRRSLLEQWQLEVRTASTDLRNLAERIERNEWKIQSTLDHTVGQISEANYRDIPTRLGQVTAAQLEQRVQLKHVHLILEATRDLVSQLHSRLDNLEYQSALAAGKVSLYCGEGRVLLRTQVGYVVCPADDYMLLAGLLDSGDLERGTRILIQSYLKPGDVFIDVGANLGLHTLAAGIAMQGVGRIISFEPFEPTSQLLKISVALNGLSDSVEIHQNALSDHQGIEKLFLGRISGHHSLYPLAADSRSTDNPVDVSLTTLDSVIPTSCRVDLMKIDVEGAELEVLKGAQLTIERNPEIALIVEFGPSHLARRNYTAPDWLDEFRKLGLEYRAINVETGLLENWSLSQLTTVESINLFFARPGAPAWERAGAK